MTPTLAYPDERLVALLRQQSAGMPPWEAYRWFDTPVQRTVALAAAPAWTRICERSVRRVVLVLATTDQTTVRFSLTGSGTGVGFVLNTSANPLILTQQEHAVLCQEEWFAQPVAGLSATVIEVLLRAWPGGDPVG